MRVWITALAGALLGLSVCAPGAGAPLATGFSNCPIRIEQAVWLTRDGEAETARARMFALYFLTAAPAAVGGTLEALVGDQRYTTDFGGAATEQGGDGRAVSPPVFFGLPDALVLSSIRVTSANVNGASVACTRNAVSFERDDPKKPGFSGRPTGVFADRSARAARLADSATLASLRLDGLLPRPSCQRPHRDPFAAEMAPARYPRIAQELGQSGTVAIVVRIRPDGSLADHEVYASSGFHVLDKAADDAATQSRFVPEIYRCEPVDGMYLFTVTFQG